MVLFSCVCFAPKLRSYIVVSLFVAQEDTFDNDSESLVEETIQPKQNQVDAL